MPGGLYQYYHALTIGRLSQDLRGDAIRTQSSLINGGGLNSCPRSNIFEALREIRNQVLHILDADRDADQRVRQSYLLAQFACDS